MPGTGFIYRLIILQDVIDVEIDHQNYSIDFLNLDIKTACKKYVFMAKPASDLKMRSMSIKIMFTCIKNGA